MDFGFSEEQEMLRDAAKRFLADNCPTKFVRQMMADGTAHDQGFWKKIVELGWPGLLIPENYGGQGGSFLDMTVIAEEAGKVLVPGPFFTSALLGAPLMIEGGSEEQKKSILPRMASGEFIGTVAIAEAAGRFDAAGIQLKASKSGSDYVLSGRSSSCPTHTSQMVSRWRAHRRQRENGISIFLVPSDAKGVTVTQLKTVDMTRRLCHIVRQRESRRHARKGGRRMADSPAHLDIATAALATEMVGTAQRALDMSVDYAKTRVQFGKPIGSFQAVKHKCVDMMVAVENARSLVYYACWTVDTKNDEAKTSVPMAKAYASDMAKNVTSEAIQVHGGIGFTWEHDMHLFHRRALAGEANFGNAPVHRETVARSLLG